MTKKEDFEFYQELLNDTYRNFGIVAIIFFVLVLLLFYFGNKYIIKRIDKLVDEASEKTIRTFQSTLDKENFKFVTLYQNQIDAIHKVYKEFNELNIAVNFILNGEKFSDNEDAQELILHIISLRHEFKKEFLRNKLLFSKELGSKIENLIVELDKFIETFQNGLFPKMSTKDIQANAELNDGYILVGLWPGNTFDSLLKNMTLIISDIEDEFRKIVGTKN